MNFPLLVLGTLAASGAAWAIARRTNHYLPAAIAGSAIVLFLNSILYYHYPSDDAYISYRYAQNFADAV